MANNLHQNSGQSCDMRSIFHLCVFLVGWRCSFCSGQLEGFEDIWGFIVLAEGLVDAYPHYLHHWTGNDEGSLFEVRSGDSNNPCNPDANLHKLQLTKTYNFTHRMSRSPFCPWGIMAQSLQRTAGREKLLRVN